MVENLYHLCIEEEYLGERTFESMRVRVYQKASLWGEESKTELEKSYRKQPWTGEKTGLYHWEGRGDAINISKLVEGGVRIWYLQLSLWGRMWSHWDGIRCDRIGIPETSRFKHSA